MALRRRIEEQRRLKLKRRPPGGSEDPAPPIDPAPGNSSEAGPPPSDQDGSVDPILFETYTVRTPATWLGGSVTRFEVLDPQLNRVLYGRRPVHTLGEEVRFSFDEQGKEPAFCIQGEKPLVVNLGASHTVTDEGTHRQIGILVRDAALDPRVAGWSLTDRAGQSAGFKIEAPGGFLGALLVGTSSPLCGYLAGQRIWTLRPAGSGGMPGISVDFSGDPRRRLDRRLGIALAALLCVVHAGTDAG